jgi:hypothetical protein
MSTAPPNRDPIRTQLQNIFLPYATERARNLYEPSDFTNARFVHYTSAEAALQIIRSKRIWMRNTTCMSDYREVLHGYDIIKEFFYEGDNRERFINGLDKISPDIGRDAITLFDRFMFDIYLNTFIAAVSEHDVSENSHGRLSMWRAFGGSTARVAIVINVPWQSEGSRALNLQFSPVAYLKKEEVYAELNKVINNISSSSAFLRTLDRQLIISWVFYMLMIGVVCLKHEGFHEEREWRVIYFPMREPSPLMESSTEVIDGIPQVVCKIPIDNAISKILDDLDFSKLFERLIIGPSQYHRVMHESFTVALTEAGIADAWNRVATSLIPIRT